MLKVLLYKNQKERITSTKINRKLLRASIYTFPQVENHIQIRVPDFVRNRSYYSVTVLRQGLPGVPLDGRQHYRRQKRFHSKTQSSVFTLSVCSSQHKNTYVKHNRNTQSDHHHSPSEVCNHFIIHTHTYTSVDIKKSLK